MSVLVNKVAIVTGASSGIGRATARLFAQEGAKLVLTARRQSALEELVADIERDGGEAVFVSGKMLAHLVYARHVTSERRGE